MKMVEQAVITEDEAQLYDRQIRLWGLDAQRRLRASRVLLIGLRGLGAEVAKNIVLAGIKSITLLDHTQRAEMAQSRTQQLNPMVEVMADNENATDKPDSFFTDFDVVCALCCKPEQQVRINQICAENDIKFFCGDSVNYVRLKNALNVDWKENAKSLRRTPSAYFVMKVINQFLETEGRRPEVETAAEDATKLRSLKPELLEQIGVKTDIIDDEFASKCFAELSPVCAVVGGVLGQEIIKAVSQKDVPHNNFFFYNGVDGSGLTN
ncbi:SAE1-like protein, partial [Mya arenaria]